MQKQRGEKERGKLGWIENKDRVKDGWITLEAEGEHLDKQAANTPTPQQGVLLMIPILHLLRESESYLHTTADGARREKHTA